MRKTTQFPLDTLTGTMVLKKLLRFFLLMVAMPSNKKKSTGYGYETDFDYAMRHNLRSSNGDVDVFRAGIMKDTEELNF